MRTKLNPYPKGRSFLSFNMRTLSAVFLCALVVVYALPLVVGALTAPPTSPIQNKDQVIEVLDNIQIWFARVFWVVAIAAVIYAAFLYLTAGGNAEQVKTANRQMLYAVIAMVVAILAYGIPALLKQFLMP